MDDRLRNVEESNRQIAGGCLTPIVGASSIVVILLIMASCCTRQHGLTNNVIIRDSVRTEYKEKIVIVKDTVFVYVPGQKSERTTQDSSSHLEVAQAVSNARIMPDGSLYHDLFINAHMIPVPIDKVIIEKETSSYEKLAEPVPLIVEKEVPRKKSWFEKTEIYGFWLLLALWGFKYRSRILRVGMKFLE